MIKLLVFLLLVAALVLHIAAWETTAAICFISGIVIMLTDTILGNDDKLPKQKLRKYKKFNDKYKDIQDENF